MLWVEGDEAAGDVAADCWTDDEDVGLIEHRAIEDEDKEEQCNGVTHVTQLQQQLHENVHKVFEFEHCWP